MEETTQHKLREALDLAVWAGEIMFGSGSEIDKVERAVNTLLAPSDCESVSILVAHNALLITTSSGDDAVTKVRPIMGQNVNFAKIRRVYALCKQVERSGYDPVQIRKRLEEIDSAAPEMPRIMVAVFVSLACGAFASIFGGGVPAFFATSLAAFMGCLTRFKLTTMGFNVTLVFMASAFVSTLAAIRLAPFTGHPDTVKAAAVLFLIPGTPLIDSVEDLIRGYITVGLTRGVMAMILAFSLAVGMVLAFTADSLIWTQP